MYRIVTGVISDVSMPSTYLFKIDMEKNEINLCVYNVLVILSYV